MAYSDVFLRAIRTQIRRVDGLSYVPNVIRARLHLSSPQAAATYLAHHALEISDIFSLSQAGRTEFIFGVSLFGEG